MISDVDLFYDTVAMIYIIFVWILLFFTDGYLGWAYRPTRNRKNAPKEYIYLRGLYQLTKFPSALGYCVKIKDTLPQIDLNILESVNGNIDLLARLDFLDQV